MAFGTDHMIVTWEIVMPLMATEESWSRALGLDSHQLWALMRETVFPLLSEVNLSVYPQEAGRPIHPPRTLPSNTA